MNSQQLELLLKNADAHPGIRKAVFDINEELQDCRRAIMELAQLMDKQTDLMNQSMAVASAVKDMVDKSFRAEDGQEAATRMIGHDKD